MSEDSGLVRFRQPDEIDDPLTILMWSEARRLLEQAVEVELHTETVQLRVCEFLSVAVSATI